MLFIYLYHGDLYSDLWKNDLYRPAVCEAAEAALTSLINNICKPR